MAVKKMKLKKWAESQKKTDKKEKTDEKIKQTKKKSIKEIDIGTGAITGEEIKPVKKSKGLKADLVIIDEEATKEIKPVKKKKKKPAVKKTDHVSINKDTDYRTKKKTVRKKYYTYDGHELTYREYRFIDEYLSSGNIRQSVINAGYESKAPSTYGTELLNKPYIANEIDHRMTTEHKNRVADGNEVMEFFSKVMRGEVKDQFGLDAPLSERLKAGNELAKRTVDIANKVAGVTQGQNEVTIKLDFDRSEL